MSERSYEVLTTPKGRLVYAWTKGVEFEEKARQQVFETADSPFVEGPVRVMPDVHAGMGSTVGTVIPCSRAIPPAAVGVDIGCGVDLTMTDIRLSEVEGKLGVLYDALYKAIPTGRTNHGGKGDRGSWGNPPGEVKHYWQAHLEEDWKKIIAVHPYLDRGASVEHLGTLGTGNHFIELVAIERKDAAGFGEEKDPDVGILIHSGSRGPGNRIGSYFTKRAKELMERFLIELPNQDLAYLPKGDPLYDEYLFALNWAQEFARLNRKIMADLSLDVLEKVGGVGDIGVRRISCHHNYTARENHGGKDIWVIRKGAVRAREGDYAVIPASMGKRSYLCKGLGSEASLCSCSHGAGRRMSRTQARKSITLEDHVKDTEGVVCHKGADVIDESPKAYKDPDAVMEAQKDLVEVVATLRQVVCVKGISDTREEG